MIILCSSEMMSIETLELDLIVIDGGLSASDSDNASGMADRYVVRKSMLCGVLLTVEMMLLDLRLSGKDCRKNLT